MAISSTQFCDILRAPGASSPITSSLSHKQTLFTSQRVPVTFHSLTYCNVTYCNACRFKRTQFRTLAAIGEWEEETEDDPHGGDSVDAADDMKVILLLLLLFTLYFVFYFVNLSVSLCHLGI